MADAGRILQVLRERVVGEEFDHQALLDAARDYARPRDLIIRPRSDSDLSVHCAFAGREIDPPHRARRVLAGASAVA